MYQKQIQSKARGSEKTLYVIIQKKKNAANEKNFFRGIKTLAKENTTADGLEDEMVVGDLSRPWAKDIPQIKRGKVCKEFINKKKLHSWFSA